MFPGHPTPFGHHPWNDPFGPLDPLTPRPPDWAFEETGMVQPPRPEDFPYTEQGRREYYTAVEQAAQLGVVMQQQQFMAMRQQTRAAGPAAHKAELEQAFLLVL